LLLLLPEVLVLVEEVELLVELAEVSPLVLGLGEAVEPEVSPLVLPLGELIVPLGVELGDELLGVWLLDPAVPPVVEDGLEEDGVWVVSVLDGEDDGAVVSVLEGVCVLDGV
jgi:hypothetical protein